MIPENKNPGTNKIRKAAAEGNPKTASSRTVVFLMAMVCCAFCFSVSVTVSLYARAKADLPYTRGDKVRFERVSIEEGLSQSTVTCILQDKRGLMWFGTEDGLNRYDGYEFVIYRPEPGNPNSLSSNAIFCLFEDRQGVLWIGTKNGLNRFDRENDTFTHWHKNTAGKGLTCDAILAICEDHEGNLWLGTADGGLNKWERKEDRFIAYQHDVTNPASLAGNHIRTLYFDHSGVLWVGTGDAGCDRFDLENERFVHYRNTPGNPASSANPTGPTSLSSNTVTAIGEDRDGNLWIGTTGGLDQLVRHKNKKNHTFIHYNHNPHNYGDPGSIGSPPVRCIYRLHTGELMIGTEGGLDRFNPEDETFTHYRYDPNDAHSLSNNIILSIYESSSNILWIGTEGGGFNKRVPYMVKFNHFRENPRENESNGCLRGKFVYSFYEDRQGMIWIGTDKGLNRFDRRSGTFTSYTHNPDDPYSLSNNFVFSIVEDRSGILWVGTWGGGFNKFDRETGRFTRYLSDPGDSLSLSHNIVLVLYEDREGEFWIGTRGGGLNKFDRQKEEFVLYRNRADDPGSLSSDYVNVVYEDRSGTLWIGTETGLNKFAGKTGTCTRYAAGFSTSGGLSNSSVLVIYESTSGIFWIGTRGGGLNRFDPHTNYFSYYTVKDGLPNDTINGILEDDRGNLWISTNQGISRFNPGDKSFRNYRVKDGLQSTEFCRGAYLKSRGGAMFFGGVNGFNMFHPDHIKDNPYIPPVIFTGFKINNESVAPAPGSPLTQIITETELIELATKDYVFSFEFAALDYSSPSANQYAYMMEGIDRDWVYSGTRRFASYSTLPPRTYIFRVKGANSDGVWNEQGTSIRIVITPAFYQTWWFRIVASVALLFFVLGIYRYRIHAIGKRTGELEAINIKLHRNIKEREAAEVQSRKSEQRLRTFLETTSEGFLEVDNDEVVLDVNPEMCAIMGRSREDIVGRFVYNFVSPEDMEIFRKHVEIRKEGMRSSYHLTMLRPDHIPVHCLINASPLFDEKGSKKGSFAMVTDITHLIEAEIEVQQTKNFLDRIFNSISSMLITINRQGVITQWNSAAEKYFSITARKAVSRKLLDVVPFLGDYREHMEKVFVSARPVELLRERVMIEHSISTGSAEDGGRDRDKVYLDILLSPLVYRYDGNGLNHNSSRSGGGKDEEEGVVEGIVIRLEDVTELERKDRQLIQAQKMETVGNLAGGLAHDFNNVLGGIVGTTSLIKYMLEKKEYVDFDEIKNRLNIIEKGADRAVDLVRQMLTLSRKTESSLVPVNLNHSLKHVLKICENTFDKSIKIVAHYHKDDVMVWADATQIEQVLLNLCINASHAMTLMRKKNEPQGGVLTVSITDSHPDPPFNAAHPTDHTLKYWLLKVEDSGVGMDSKTIAKIFDPFFTTKAKNKGTGLGLAVAYNIVQQHKGFIEVDSRPGKGSTFKVFLPQLQVDDQVYVLPPKKPEEKLFKGSGLILVVDDEKGLRQTIKEILETCGYDVITADDGEKALDIFREKFHEIKVVLLDMVMPNMSGKEAYIEMKKIHPAVKVVLTSGFKYDQRVKETLKHGVNAFIQKPFSMVDLSREISKIIRE
jgi:PAS domain S-box-containing protein